MIRLSRRDDWRQVNESKTFQDVKTNSGALYRSILPFKNSNVTVFSNKCLMVKILSTLFIIVFKKSPLSQSSYND